MKILYLLFPFFLLLIQGAAGGNSILCRRRGGFCASRRCRYPATPIGRCSIFRPCCRR
ncbi:spheniscin-2-like [Mycteria americana]|uniref:spheniscin-2-like n=1 Tax=Mycteria americana TaxID=33587 RepID=UPI003F58FF05